MSDILPQNWITSKEILAKTGISRATLNNYIKMKIIPRPVVQRPRDHMNGTKKIGYFPDGVLDRIALVKSLKQESISMAEIANRLQNVRVDGYQDDTNSSTSKRDIHALADSTRAIDGRVLNLTFEDIQLPAYLINYDFDVVWMNLQAEKKIFKREVNLKGKESRNIFRLIFSWEFHDHVRNWRDLLTLHMSFVKTRYSRNWCERLYPGISEIEISTLQKIYDRVRPFSTDTIKHSFINLSMQDGTTEAYRVYNIFVREGIFFLYAPNSFLALERRGGIFESDG
ncbi:MAG: hypothetical protein U9N82_00430 [Thermodesulfobacteriota bacterium]|nr:hypothetical protein [Thermodesulfobacteriota bacterium]